MYPINKESCQKIRTHLLPTLLNQLPNIDLINEQQLIYLFENFFIEYKLDTDEIAILLEMFKLSLKNELLQRTYL